MSVSLSVRAVILHQGKLLCVRLKNYQGAITGDFWCLPGGGVDEGEALLPALEREMIEETGVKPQIGRLLYVNQFMSGDNDITEFFFHVTNALDYSNVDLAQSSHGHEEIEEIAFVDPANTRILPKFLTDEPLAEHISDSEPVKIFSYDTTSESSSGNSTGMSSMQK